jgi:1-deoxy-D-xylulose-5-phosphate reductoisomerase
MRGRQACIEAPHLHNPEAVTQKRVAILGCTGSIGTQALDIVAQHPDRFQVVALQAHRSAGKVVEQARRFAVDHLCLTDPAAAGQARVADLDVQVHAGKDGLLQMLEAARPELVVHGITGAAGLPASEWTLGQGIALALANKESLVIAGSYLMPLARRTGAEILPVDSEHCAIHQCLRGNRREDLRRILLTGSGGPFRERDLATFADIAPGEALNHPTWDMGPRITVGSATMMNKAFEIIEAHWLFDLAPDQIEVVIHPQSIVHSMVEYTDGSIMAQCGIPDMRVPILYCMGWPERLPFRFEGFAPDRWRELRFETLDRQRYPAIDLAYEVLQRGGDSGAVLNAADEVLTERFLHRELPFPAISELVREVLHSMPVRTIDSLADAYRADAEARRMAAELADSYSSRNADSTHP